ncbi:MAG: pantoate--beta-alanine ligase [Marivirga sp.]|jgi:pantoate--beta-alanine ligase
MYVSNSISDIQSVINKHKDAGKTIGFVPTMGALHDGHLSLIKNAQMLCDIVIASIYINPTQFNNSDDLSAYPKTLAADIEKLSTHHCDLLFTPSDAVMYPEKNHLTIHFGVLEEVMEGAYRPGHFSGVGQIVTKLFNIIQPHKAFFGQKDFQQLSLIKRLVKEFCIPLEIIAIPIEREENGLAMSSRNEMLHPDERKEAKIFYDTLSYMKQKIVESPHRSFEEIKELATSYFSRSQATLEYFDLVSDTDLKTKNDNYLQADSVMCIAGHIGNVRLIDNMYLIS